MFAGEAIKREDEKLKRPFRSGIPVKDAE